MSAILQTMCNGCADKFRIGKKYEPVEIGGQPRAGKCPLCGGYYQSVMQYELVNRAARATAARRAQETPQADTRARSRDRWRDWEQTGTD